MEIKIVICDDERSQREYLKKLVADWGRLRSYALELKEFDSAEAFLFDYEADSGADILLLDIQMKRMDGVTLAKSLRLQNRHIQIVFVTGYAEFISEGYEVAALHYLMKPVGAEKLRDVLDRAAAVLSQPRRSAVFESENGRIRIFTDDVMLAEAFAHEVELTLKTGEKRRVKAGISVVEKTLGSGFFKCHRSYVAGLKYIRRVSRNSVQLENGVVIPLARGQYAALNDAIIKYFP